MLTPETLLEGIPYVVVVSHSIFLTTLYEGFCWNQDYVTTMYIGECIIFFFCSYANSGCNLQGPNSFFADGETRRSELSDKCTPKIDQC